ncbi:MAG TPA: PAS domain S-box protein [Anaerolineales bacterium]|nr:PAS domain S-box protein [Anaerolineales bacterium]
MKEKLPLKKSGKPVRKKRTVGNTGQPQIFNHERNPQFHKLLDAFPVAVVMVGLNGMIQFINQKAKALLGAPDPSLKLEDWPQAFGLYLDDGKLTYPVQKLPLSRALRGERVEESEEIILRREGEEKGIWISISTETLRDENGNVDGALALIRDISYRKTFELSREKQVQRIEALYRLSRVIAESGTELNKIAELTTEFTSTVIGDLSLMTLLNKTHEKLNIVAFHDTDPTAQALLRKLLTPDFEFDYSQRLSGGVVKSGEPVLIPSIPSEQLRSIALPAFQEFIDVIGIESVIIVPLIGRGGILGTLNVSRHRGSKPLNLEDQSFLTDIAYRVALAIENCRLFESLRTEISEKLSTKRALDMSEERFRLIFESVTLGIKVLDHNGDILQTNPAFQEMLGYAEDEFTGKHFTTFLHPLDISRASKLFQDVKSNGVTSFGFDHRTLHRDQSIVWAKTFFTVVKKDDKDDEPAFIVGIVENVTEQKRLQFEMGELNSRLQNSMELERLHLAQELHDNPMQVLYSANYRLEELRQKTDPEMGESLREVKDTIQGVLQDLRAMAKELRPPTISSFGLENAIRSHAFDVQEKHPNLQLYLSLAHDQQSLPDNVRLALFRVLQQALANVVHHADATEVRIHFSFDAEETHLEIRDNGKGFTVPANWIEFVRQEHYGLAGAAERVHALGGVFKVESSPGSSTTVRVTIPWSDPD